MRATDKKITVAGMTERDKSKEGEQQTNRNNFIFFPLWAHRQDAPSGVRRGGINLER